MLQLQIIKKQQDECLNTNNTGKEWPTEYNPGTTRNKPLDVNNMIASNNDVPLVQNKCQIMCQEEWPTLGNTAKEQPTNHNHGDTGNTGMITMDTDDASNEQENTFSKSFKKCELLAGTKQGVILYQGQKKL